MRIWKKISFSVGALLIATMTMAQEITLDVVPGVIIIEENHAWVCFPPSREVLMCARVHKKQFCPTEIVESGALKCFGPLMADE